MIHAYNSAKNLLIMKIKEERWPRKNCSNRQLEQENSPSTCGSTLWHPYSGSRECLNIRKDNHKRSRTAQASQSQRVASRNKLRLLGQNQLCQLQESICRFQYYWSYPRIFSSDEPINLQNK